MLKARFLAIVMTLTLSFAAAQSNSFGIGIGTMGAFGAGNVPLLVNFGLSSGFSVGPGLEMRTTVDYTSVAGLALISLSAEPIFRFSNGLYLGAGLRMWSAMGEFNFGFGGTLGYTIPVNSQMGIFTELQPSYPIGGALIVYGKAGIQLTY